MKRFRGLCATVEGFTWWIEFFCCCGWFWTIHQHASSSVKASSDIPFRTSSGWDDDNDDDDDHSLSKLCGTYRAYPYVGLRCQYETSPLMGLMWYKPLLTPPHQSSSSSSSSSLQSRLRHESTHDDQLDRFGWNQHDGKSYGRQNIADSQNQVNLTIQWIYLGVDYDDEMTAPIEIPFADTRQHQLQQQHRSLRWALRVRGEYYQRDDDVDGNQDSESSNTFRDLSLLWYVATLDNLTSTYHPSEGYISGNQYRVWINPSSNNSHPIYMDERANVAKEYNSTYFAAFQVPPCQHYNPKPTILQEVRNPTSSLPPHLFDPTNLYRAATARTGNQVIQQVFFNLPFEVDFHFSHHHHDVPSTHEQLNHVVDGDAEVVANWITTSKGSKDDEWNRVTMALENARDNFVSVFAKTFIDNPFRHHRRDSTTRNSTEHRNALGNDGSSTSSWSEGQIQTGHYALGNMLSSITYMHGDRQVYDIETDQIVSQPSHAGWTVVPDRPDHAQGYLWDDGFQQQLIRHWDIEWSLKVLRSWFSQVDDDGWIPRQLILGDEARWSARSSSWSQVPGTANPPSHHWVVEVIIRDDDDNKSDNDNKKLLRGPSFVIDEFLSDIWPALERNLEWYLRTQASDIPGFFRWVGRTEEYCLPSGMDDYPRAPLLTKKEAHLDLHCWMIVSSRVAAKVATRLSHAEKAHHFNDLNQKLTTALLDNFWDDTRQLFDDFYYSHDNKVVFVGHLGYLNFFPVLLGVVPTDDPLFGRIMDQFLDRENGLWTQYGLRSLSLKDPYFQEGDNYWTGSLWLNINYLALSSFFRYVEEPYEYPMPEPLRRKIHRAYCELRKGLIDLVVTSFMSTGFIWEVYNGTTGEGFDNHPFTGWSALIVNAMAELY